MFFYFVEVKKLIKHLVSGCNEVTKESKEYFTSIFFLKEYIL